MCPIAPLSVESIHIDEDHVPLLWLGTKLDKHDNGIKHFKHKTSPNHQVADKEVSQQSSTKLHPNRRIKKSTKLDTTHETGKRRAPLVVNQKNSFN